MAGVPQDRVGRRLEHAVECEREFDGAEVRAEVATDLGDRRDDEVPDLAGQVTELVVVEPSQVARLTDALEVHAPCHAIPKRSHAGRSTRDGRHPSSNGAPAMSANRSARARPAAVAIASSSAGGAHRIDHGRRRTPPASVNSTNWPEVRCSPGRWSDTDRTTRSAVMERTLTSPPGRRGRIRNDRLDDERPARPQSLGDRVEASLLLGGIEEVEERVVRHQTRVERAVGKIVDHVAEQSR